MYFLLLNNLFFLLVAIFGGISFSGQTLLSTNSIFIAEEILLTIGNFQLFKIHWCCNCSAYIIILVIYAHVLFYVLYITLMS